jgi:hypothetical protein
MVVAGDACSWLPWCLVASCFFFKKNPMTVIDNGSQSIFLKCDILLKYSFKIPPKTKRLVVLAGPVRYDETDQAGVVLLVFFLMCLWSLSSVVKNTEGYIEERESMTHKDSKPNEKSS